MTVILKHATRWRFPRCYRCKSIGQPLAAQYFFLWTVVREPGTLSLVPVSAAANPGSADFLAVLCVRRRRGQLQVVPCAHISTAVKDFSLAESQAELILKMYSMSTYSANFVIENGDNFRVSGARVPTARPSPPARARF